MVTFFPSQHLEEFRAVSIDSLSHSWGRPAAHVIPHSSTSAWEGKKWNTVQHVPVTKCHETSPSNRTLWNTSKQGNTMQCLPRTKAAMRTKMLSALESKVDETEQVLLRPTETWTGCKILLASNQHQQALALSHSGPWLHWCLLAK